MKDGIEVTNLQLFIVNKTLLSKRKILYLCQNTNSYSGDLAACFYILSYSWY